MKKLLILNLIALTIPLFGLVWSEDPSLTPEERQQRRELNARIKKSGLMGSARLKGLGGEVPTAVSDDNMKEKMYGLGLVRELPERENQDDCENSKFFVDAQGQEHGLGLNIDESAQAETEDTDDVDFDDED